MATWRQCVGLDVHRAELFALLVLLKSVSQNVYSHLQYDSLPPLLELLANDLKLSTLTFPMYFILYAFV